MSELKVQKNKYGIFGKSTMPKLKWEDEWKSFTLNLFSGTKFRIWCYISKFKEKPLHFCLIIGGVITLDTAHVGKKIYGRLNLTRLFGKDFHVYSSGDSVNKSSNHT
jgi:hypothetical protein